MSTFKAVLLAGHFLSVFATTIGSAQDTRATPTFQRIQAAQRLNGQTPINGWLGFVLLLVFQPAFYGYMQSGLNSAWRATADAS